MNYINTTLVNCKVLLVGDAYQLINFTEKKAHVFNAGYDTAVLNIPQRFSSGSQIEKLSDQLRDFIDGSGPFPAIAADGVTVHQLKGQEFQQKINQVFADPDGFHVNKILGWTNDKVQQYNLYCRQLHYSKPGIEPGELLVANDTIVSTRDAIICRNEELIQVISVTDSLHHDIDSYRIRYKKAHSKDRDEYVAYIPKNPGELSFRIKQAKQQCDWHNYFILKKEFADLRQRYAATVYKAQGSTYENVFIDLNDLGKNPDLNTLARMTLVAISRAKQNVYLFGSLPAINPTF